MRPRGSQVELERRRQFAVRQILEGSSPSEVADTLGAGVSSVRRWMHDYLERGFESLEARDVPGRPHKLTPTQEKVVLRWLNERPMNLGFPTELWTGRRVSHLIEQEFGVRMNPHYLAGWLRARDLTPQKPQREPFERDRDVIAEWASSNWPSIQRRAAKTGASIAFVDESGVLMAPLVRRSWAPRGHPPTLFQKGRGNHEKVSIAAAIWYRTRPTRLELFFKTLTNEYFDNYLSACFLEVMLVEIPKPIIVVWDGGNMHKGDYIRSLQERYGKDLQLEKLPSYAPMLNPVELLWNWLKYDRLCNFAPANAEELNKRVIETLDSIRTNQVLLTSFFEGSEMPVPRSLLS